MAVAAAIIWLTKMASCAGELTAFTGLPAHHQVVMVMEVKDELSLQIWSIAQKIGQPVSGR